MAKDLYSKLMRGAPSTLGGSTQKMAKDVLKNSMFSKRRAAEKCGVSKETFRRWLKGDQETKDRESLEQAQREARVKPRNAAKFAKAGRPQSEPGEGEGGGGAGSSGASGGMVRVKATITISSDTRTRWLDIGSEVPAGRMAEVVDAMVRSGPEAANGVMSDLIQAHYLGQGTPGADIQIHDVRL